MKQMTAPDIDQPCVFYKVGLDENDRPAVIPGLVLTTEKEKEEWENAKKRREIRMLRKEEGF